MEDYVARNKEAFDLLGSAATDVTQLMKNASICLPAFQMMLSGSRVLDLGCGVGRDSLRLKRYSLEVQGLDISEAMLAEAKRQVEGVDFWQGDFRELPFDNASFDGVWANGSLFYVTPIDLGKTLQEVMRILKPGGVFFASYLLGEGDFYHNNLYHHCYQEADIEQNYRTAGFKTIDRTWTTAEDKFVCILAVK